MGIAKFLTILCVALFGILAILLLFGNRHKSSANRILGGFFLLWSLNFLDGYLLLDGFYLQYPSLALWEDPLVLLYGPAIYFYSKALVVKTSWWQPAYFWHFIPFVLLNIVSLFGYHLLPLEQKQEIIYHIVNLEQPPELFFLTLGIFIHILAYFSVSWISLTRYFRALKDNYSNLNILRVVKSLRMLVALVLLSLTVSVLQFFGKPMHFEFGLILLILCILFFIGRLIFNAFEEPFLLVNPEIYKHLDSDLTLTDKLAIAEKIQVALKQQKLFLDPDLTVSELSTSIGTPSRQVSQVINQQINQNFFDLINSYRIQEAQRILKESGDDKLTVLEVMYQVGFNSKSSFNTQFKKRTGVTPSEFRKLHR